MILSDFHPLKRCIGPDFAFVPQYFDEELISGDVAYKSYFPEQGQSDFPEVALTPHTLSQIISTVIQSGFQLNRFDEHRGWNNENILWEFTIAAKKI